MAFSLSQFLLPELLIFITDLSVKERCLPNLAFTTPRSTGQPNFPLLEAKFAANFLASGVKTNFPVDVFLPAFLLDAAIASLIKRSISLSKL